MRPLSLLTKAGTMPLLAFALAGVCGAQPGPAITGRWAGPSDWGLIGVHMALLPGPTGYHSQVLWWQGEDNVPAAFGGLWGWNPTPASDCNTYPQNFTALTTPVPDVNIFCAGNAHMPDGRLMVVGGTDPGETGITSSVVYDPLARTWTHTADMSQRRWYPTLTGLADGRMLVSSGSSYIH